MNPNIPKATFDAIQNNYSGIIIQCNGLDSETAGISIESGSADLVRFGRSFLANPDFVDRIEQNLPLNEVDFSTLYTIGEQRLHRLPDITVID